ncbi:LacI family DNA-binding transcriptional regulator [Hydrotalea sandarakina]|jgi:LacI family transcriptional regulator|uniref:LacI family transcriptional regulator n=1 Tax=Hydrotalea sandarakina TaxID=1004304 RepID=A0A2W7TEQ3_9BACT|nr:LacI family DNA-binding transcriptional regulator [Hydrotalea sandarakina]PZX61802.1 LacI family transcriptional regulator [Hydrotalea sandarakina]
MKFEAVTIKDIAKALGLSTSTVSRALRDSYEISEETKQLVLNYAKEINYRPNPIALSLKEKRSRSIGIIVSEIANSFFSQAINGIESVAHLHGYNVIITQSKESYEREIANIQYLSSRSVDGCIISVSAETKDYTHITELYERNLPIVCFDRVIEALNTFKVTVNSFEGAYNATTHLIKNGFKKIAMLSGSSVLSISKDRLSGYRQALIDNGIEFNENYVAYCQHGGLIYEEVEAALNYLLNLKPKTDAIFAGADKLTTNCMRYCKAHHIDIPKQLALIGFSNLDFTDLLCPPLSVVRQPAFEMGRISAELLIKMIESKRPITDFESKILPAEIYARASTEPINTKKKNEK